MKRLLSIVCAGVLAALPLPALAAGNAPVPPEKNWPSEGYFGSFDKASLQRGLKVYTNVCASCHGLKLLHYRDLVDLGYSQDEVKAYAAEYEVLSEPDEEGEREMIPASPANAFVSPYENEEAARASNNGALPPDLSLIIKSRNFGKGNIFVNFFDMLRGRGYASGADYLYALLTGYEEEPPEGFDLGEGMHYNHWFAGHAIAMAPPLYEDDEADDGTPGTIEQQAADVTSFLMWAAEPRLEDRRAMGIKVMIFLALFTLVMFVLKRNVWRDVH